MTEYLMDYAPEKTAAKGWKVIEKNLLTLDETMQKSVRERIERIKQGERDLYY